MTEDSSILARIRALQAEPVPFDPERLSPSERLTRASNRLEVLDDEHAMPEAVGRVYGPLHHAAQCHTNGLPFDGDLMPWADALKATGEPWAEAGRILSGEA